MSDQIVLQNYFDLLFSEIWNSIFNFSCLQNGWFLLEYSSNYFGVSKTWKERTENATSKFKALSISTRLIFNNKDTHSYIWKLPNYLLQNTRSLKVDVIKPWVNDRLKLCFSIDFIPFVNIKELTFVIPYDYKNDIRFLESNEMSYPTCAKTLLMLPSLKTIDLVHMIKSNDSHILTITKRIDPNENTLISLIITKEEPFQSFNSHRLSIPLTASYGGRIEVGIQKIKLEGKSWHISEIMSFSNILIGLTQEKKLKLVAIDVDKGDEEEIKNWVIKEVGSNFEIKKIENSLCFFDYICDSQE